MKNVLFLCGRENTYTRNETLLKAFSQNAKVINITSDHKSYLVRHLQVMYRFLTFRGKYDLVFVGFYGQILVLFVKMFTKKPIIFDAFISTYQTLCFDRKKFSSGSLIGRLVFALDKYACIKADTVLLDTNAHIDYFVKTFGLPRDKFHRVFVGANEELFYPRPHKKNKRPIVFTYSAYQPLHGMEYVVRAAKLLEGKADFVIVGKGMERQKIDQLIKDLKISNTKLIDWVPYEKLPDYIAEADICLGGHFGDTDKAKMVIAGKTFQFIAMKKPVIVSENIANRELFAAEDVMFCDVSDSCRLVDAINDLIESSTAREELKIFGYRRYTQSASYESRKKEINKIMEKLNETYIHSRA